MNNGIKILLTALLFSNFIFAQQNDTIPKYKKLNKFSVLSIDHFNYSKSDIDTERGKVAIDMKEFSIKGSYLVTLKEKEWYLLNNVRYTYFNYNTKIERSSEEQEKNFHSIAYSIGLIKILPKRWKLTVSLKPTIASDFKSSLSKDDFVMQGAVLAIKRANPNFEYGFGVSYTTSLGKPMAIPIVQLTYKRGNWKTLAVLPSYISQIYSFNKNTQLGVKLALYGNLYNVEADRASSVVKLNKVSYSRTTIGPEFRQKLFGNIYLNVGTGIAVRNILEVKDNDLNTAYDFDVKNKFFFNVGLKLLR